MNVELNDAEKQQLSNAAQELAAYCSDKRDREATARTLAAQPNAFHRLGIVPAKDAAARAFFLQECQTAKVDTEKLVEDLSGYLLGDKIPLDIVRASTGELIIPANYKITKGLIRKVVTHRHDIDVDPSPLRNRLRILLKLGVPGFMCGSGY